VRVELAEWTQRLPTRTRRQVRRNSIAGVVLGCLLMVLAVVGGVVRVVDRGFAPEVLGAVAILVIGGLCLWIAARRLRWMPPGAPDSPVRFTAPYAFELTDDSIEFPAFQGRRAESWGLDRTEVEVTGQGRGESVRLRHPDHRPRRFLASALAESPADVVAVVESRRPGRTTG